MEAMTPIQTCGDQYGNTADNDTNTDTNAYTNTNASVCNSDLSVNVNCNHHQKTKRNAVVKRPMNAFLLWARGERKRVSSDGYGVSQTSLSKVLGETWRHMSIDEKQPFLDMAETLKRQHHIDNPDYKFKPKQRLTNGHQTTIKKNHTVTSQKQFSSMKSSSHSTSSMSHSFQSFTNVTPHPVQSNVLALCETIIDSGSENINDWFSEMTRQPQTVIVTPLCRTQTSPTSSRRAVRIQIINKHDDVALTTASTLLPLTPPPPPRPPSTSSFVTNESATKFVDYLDENSHMFSIPTSTSEHILASNMNNSTEEYNVLHDPSINTLSDLDQHYDSSSWIDTPLSNFGANSMDMVSSSPYTSYEFLSL